MADKIFPTKKLINSPSTSVEDSLNGLTLVYPSLQLLRSRHKIVIRSDIDDVISSGQVTLVCGGGSGHEPAHVGFVGKGMLTAAVPGAVFASPPSEAILASFRAVTTPAGTLAIVTNYTGDRLNFGIAVEKARAEGIKVEMIVIGDDCALPSVSKTAGRRGLCGTILIYKIAGAMAEQGCDLDTIYKKVLKVAECVGTIGVSLNPCSVPGRSPNFILGPDEIELGLGIHGEAGYKRCKLESCEKMVEIILNQLSSIEPGYKYFQLQPNSHVVLVVNNLGGLSNLEMGIVAKEAIRFLTNKRGVCVEMAYMGTFMTSLEMQGVSLTLLEYTEELGQYLDCPTEAPAWPNGCTGRRLAKGGQFAINASQRAEDRDIASKTLLGVGIGKESLFIECLESVCLALSENKDRLDKLDSIGGDGDCGSTLYAGSQAILTEIDSLAEMNHSQSLLKIASIVERVMGGASGALYSLFLTAAAGQLDTPCVPRSWVEALSRGVESVAKYGGASPGDRTMLDALHPTVHYLYNSSTINSNAIQSAVQLCNEGANATKGMCARAGRASYVSQDLLRDEDPGAVAVSIWFNAIGRVLAKKWKC
ncbi:Bifunctional ATP-dependent dihydroxyacetone kinase/FAD-AMP lyase (cyclizing)-like [Oopsacas minuta]|uniref:Triokinase/FMN cyclase n=1 Tax=Oopsacas minuta TaxID=111878 RepID=A0AAV7JKB0_9METZ|nr:Bifunctional ATP-dependent dihydroxyacetone kinase/FAD-AMP lyase (cyclizing)-like [Oopsacas minuta]